MTEQRATRSRSKLAIAACLTLFLTACATTAGYERTLQSWIGKSETELVRQWGVPRGVYESGGIRFLTYSRSGQGYFPGVAPTYQTTMIGRTAYTQPIGGMPPMVISRRCDTTFEVAGGVVTSWRWEGNACKAIEQ